ncbi:leucine-rich repeat domain-containing protein [Chryseobacterium sp. MEBOG07]|uniref:leucine-rich repeat domain-containing protein n=1 Tax=Chryseobacterium sp. MEBOG07 TaxID=2879939 RepID=UPI001F4128DC|nr:T9SS type A sorting domain-containing protein [Chryseobacterium sp. MEBOG07]UKB80236.1 T9SS type A sorting domain-containing protein [Chryseobacterium sp. MEBOG07]
MFSQAIVNFSDATFKSKLVFSTPSAHIAKNSAGNWIKVDTNNDMEIQVTEAQQVTELWLLGNNISSLNGIQHFSNLKVLEIGSNTLTNLDLSQNTQIKTVFCDNNNLTSLIVNQNLLLEYLSCSWNNLSTINLPNSNFFQKLYCTNNQISNLNTSNNSGLKVLRVESNPITNLSLNSNVNLEELNFSTTSISNINLSSNINLKKLTTSSNLTTLNVAQNTNLQELYTQGSNLTSVDVRNGNNSNMLNVLFGNVTQSPLLKCIFVDWKDSSTLTNFWIKPYTAIYVESATECNSLLATGETTTKKQFSIYPNPVKNSIHIVSDSAFKRYEIVSLEGKIIKSGDIQNSKIDTSLLIKGTYFLKLYDGKNYVTKKIIKI